MNVVAVFDSRGQTWSLRLVDEAGYELSSSGTVYPSMAEALRAGGEHRARLAAQRPSILVGRAGGGARPCGRSRSPTLDETSLVSS